MVKEDLSFVAEALLALCEADRRPSILSEKALRRRADRERGGTDGAERLPSHPENDPLLQSEWNGVFQSALLTPRQAEVLGQRLEGWTFEEIGARYGRTKQGAQRVFVQALKKLARSYHVYPYTGLSDVYRNEVHRGPRRGFGTMRP